MLMLVRIMNTGNSCPIEVMSIILDRKSPMQTPHSVEAVNCETLLPDISPMLLRLANCTLMLALDAEKRKKQILENLYQK